jgi:hypothetical protein
MGTQANHIEIVLNVLSPGDPVGCIFVEFITLERGFDGFVFDNRSSSVDNSKGVIPRNIGTSHNGSQREKYIGGKGKNMGTPGMVKVPLCARGEHETRRNRGVSKISRC